ncbi:CASP-like protein 4A3 isoform X2 [Iris pallida]|uniref:CASP-like protein n=1 Tax=Iris pallida TaxID=29817 RepID=A0AAX6DY36_IRIPA|nr:CASP-like protein 4A3 isoform X2 [Iris pallida]
MKPTVRSPPPLASDSAVTESPVRSPHKTECPDLTGSNSEVTGSPVRSTPPQETTKEAVKTSESPVQEAEHRTAPSEVRREEKSSSFWSLLRDDDEEQTGVRSAPRETKNMAEQLPLQSLILAAEHRNAPPPTTTTTHHQKESSLSSASSFKSSSHRETAEDQNGVRSPPRETRKILESLPLRLLMPAAERRTAPPPPLPTHHQKESSLSSASSFKSLSLREAMEDPTASPPGDDALAMTVASIMSSPVNGEEGRTPVAANRMAARGTGPAAAVKGKGKAGGTGLRVVRERREVVRAAGWLRVSALVLSLLSVSLMAADRTSGWAGDSFERYREFRYCFSVNVIVFVYSSFQVYMRVHYMCRKQHIMSRQISYYFDFSMDQANTSVPSYVSIISRSLSEC